MILPSKLNKLILSLNTFLEFLLVGASGFIFGAIVGVILYKCCCQTNKSSDEVTFYTISKLLKKKKLNKSLVEIQFQLLGCWFLYFRKALHLVFRSQLREAVSSKNWNHSVIALDSRMVLAFIISKW